MVMIRNNANQMEQGIRVKLVTMTNALARISETRMRIKASTEQAKKDVSEVIDHQMSRVRNRERELYKELDRLLERKESVLGEQHDQITKAMGALQQALTCLLQGKIEPATAQELLMRINAIDLRPRETLGTSFEYDPTAMRSAIMNFGNIFDAGDCSNLKSSTIPIGEVEPYEDDIHVLSHKSVLRLYPQTLQQPSIFQNIIVREKSDNETVCKNISVEKQQQEKEFASAGEGFNFWLSHVKNMANKGDCQAEVVDCTTQKDANGDERDRLTSFGSSSFEVMNTTYSLKSHCMDEDDDDKSTAMSLNSTTILAENDVNRTYIASGNNNGRLLSAVEAYYGGFSTKDWLSSKTKSCSHQGDLRKRDITSAAGNAPFLFANEENSRKKFHSNSEQAFSPFSHSRQNEMEEEEEKDSSIISSDVSIQRFQNATFYKPTSDLLPNLCDQTKWLAISNVANETETKSVITNKEISAKTEEIMNVDNEIKQKEAEMEKKKHPYGGILAINDTSFWLRDVPKKPTNRPMNEMAEDLSTWESVLGWKSILEKIHASGEECWLSPSSRAIKNGQ